MNQNQTPTDPFAHLKAIAANQNTTTTTVTQHAVRFWSYEKDGNIIGTIIGFNSFQHPQFGEQHTITVQLADTNEWVSAFLNDWLKEGLRRKQAIAGDLILILFLGKDPKYGFNRFYLEIEKPQPPIQYYSTQQPQMG